MAGGWGERIVWLLDRCWPFPLGIVACTLVLVTSTGIWLVIRDPRPTRVDRPSGQPGSTEIPAQAPSTSPPGTPDAASTLPNPTADRAPASRPTPSEMASPTAAPEKSQGAKPKAQPRPVARQLSAAQRAAIADRLTIGRFLMDRKDYSAAIKEFQAALAIDPTNREAQAAIRRARAADAN